MSNSCSYSFGKRCIYRSNGGIVIQKPNEKVVMHQRNNLRDVVIKYAKYYEETLRQTNEYNEDEINVVVFRWIEDTLSYYESNFADALDSIVSYFEKLIAQEESKNRNNSIQKIKVNNYVQIV